MAHWRSGHAEDACQSCRQKIRDLAQEARHMRIVRCAAARSYGHLPAECSASGNSEGSRVVRISCIGNIDWRSVTDGANTYLNPRIQNVVGLVVVPLKSPIEQKVLSLLRVSYRLDPHTWFTQEP